jgi:hypothetical protein
VNHDHTPIFIGPKVFADKHKRFGGSCVVLIQRYWDSSHAIVIDQLFVEVVHNDVAEGLVVLLIDEFEAFVVGDLFKNAIGVEVVAEFVAEDFGRLWTGWFGGWSGNWDWCGRRS